MKKINIIKKNEEFEKIIKNRTQYKNNYLNIYIRKNNIGKDMFGISVTKKTGIAVIRNKIKRQIKSIIDKYDKFTSNYDYIIITKPKIVELNYKELNDIITILLDRIIKEANKWRKHLKY